MTSGVYGDPAAVLKGLSQIRLEQPSQAMLFHHGMLFQM